MRTSIWTGLITLALGIVLSYLADALIQLQAANTMQTVASMTAAILFVLFSASMLGLGAGLVIHWIIGFATHWKAFLAEIVLSFAIFFIGIGATIMTRPWWTAFQLFFTFLIASITIFVLSFNSLYGGIAAGVGKVKKYIKKRFKR